MGVLEYFIYSNIDFIEKNEWLHFYDMAVIFRAILFIWWGGLWYHISDMYLIQWMLACVFVMNVRALYAFSRNLSSPKNISLLLISQSKVHYKHAHIFPDKDFYILKWNQLETISVQSYKIFTLKQNQYLMLVWYG